MTQTGPKPAGGSPGEFRFGDAASLGMTLAVGMAVFAFIGHWIDSKRGTEPWWTLAGVLLGLVYGAYEVWKVVRTTDPPAR